MSHLIIRGNALRIPLADNSVDLIVTSPPYWAQRSYRDGGKHYDAQIGSEPHPRYWLEAMWDVMKECWRVMKDDASCIVNLGDKRAGSGGHNNSNLATSTLTGGKNKAAKDVSTSRGLVGGGPTGATSILAGRSHTAERDRVRASHRNAPDCYERVHFGRRKSRQLLPERFVIGCEDGLADPDGIGWIVRQVKIWEKANGLPESVTDRTRDNFEYLYHLTKSERYYAAVDEIREPQERSQHQQHRSGEDKRTEGDVALRVWQPTEVYFNPLGKLPGSVWRIASEPLRIPGWAKEKYHLPDHFAAFPQEIPRRLILGFSPPGICTACGEGRRPVVSAEKVKSPVHGDGSITGNRNGGPGERQWDGLPRFNVERSILGYACACTPTETEATRYHVPGYEECEDLAEESGRYDACTDPDHWKERYVKVPRLAGWIPPPIRPAVVLDPFGGTGTTVLVAEALGRAGISLDLSADYCNLARWRIEESGHGAKAEQRTWKEAQGQLL